MNKTSVEVTAGNAPRFVLLCHQRSGSNALSSIMPAAGIKLYGQLFNPSWEKHSANLRNLGLPSFRPPGHAMLHYGNRPLLRYRLSHLRARLAGRERDLDDFMSRFWDTFHPDAGVARGFKLHDFQLSDADMTRLLNKHVDKAIILHRRNLLKAAVSWGYALQTGIWVKRGRSGTELPTKRLDIAELAWFMEKTATEVERWRKLTSAVGLPTLELVYEDDIATRDFAPIFDFLDHPVDGDLDFATRRIAAPDYPHIANAREIDRALGSEPTGRLFD